MADGGTRDTMAEARLASDELTLARAAMAFHPNDAVAANYYLKVKQAADHLTAVNRKNIRLAYARD